MYLKYVRQFDSFTEICGEASQSLSREATTAESLGGVALVDWEQMADARGEGLSSQGPGGVSTADQWLRSEGGRGKGL